MIAQSIAFVCVPGSGTGFDEPAPEGPVHVDAARLAVTRGETEVYNVVVDDGTVSSRKAMVILGWRPDFPMSQLAV